MTALATESQVTITSEMCDVLKSLSTFASKDSTRHVLNCVCLYKMYNGNIGAVATDGSCLAWATFEASWEGEFESALISLEAFRTINVYMTVTELTTVCEKRKGDLGTFHNIQMAYPDWRNAIESLNKKNCSRDEPSLFGYRVKYLQKIEKACDVSLHDCFDKESKNDKGDPVAAFFAGNDINICLMMALSVTRKEGHKRGNFTARISELGLLKNKPAV